MRRCFAVISLIVSLALAAPALGQAEDQGRLWRITGEGIAPSHLFATLPSSDPRLLELPEKVVAAAGEAQYLAVEIVRSPEVRETLDAAMFSATPGELRDALGPDLFAEAVVRGDLLVLPGELIETAQPWALYLLLSVPPSEYQRQREGHLDQESALQISAARQGLPLQTLELPEQRIRAMQALDLEDQRLLLKSVLSPAFDAKAHLEHQIELYLAGDMPGLRRAAYGPLRALDPAAAARVEQRLIVERAEVMAGRMGQALPIAPGFFAMPARILAGDGGLLARLRAAGYRLERVL